MRPPPARRPTTRPSALLERVWPPMLARLSTGEEVGDATHVYEVKYDGFRAVAGVAGGRCVLRSRRGNALEARWPALAQALAALKVQDLVLDGEVVAFDAQGVSRFQLLQNATRQPVRYAAFDLLWLNGEDLRGLPLEQRRARLRRLLARAPEELLVSETVDCARDDALAWARRQGLEGVMAKRRGSPYAGGRGDAWLKLKVRAGQEVVLLGYLPIKAENREDEIGALLIGVHDADGFHEVGKVGTGFDVETRRELKRLLDRDRRKTPCAVDARAHKHKDAVWVRPRLVANVLFTEWTEDGRMRHPVFQGLRSDKRPEEVVRERAPEPPAATRGAGARRAPLALAARTATLPQPEDLPMPRPARPSRAASKRSGAAPRARTGARKAAAPDARATPRKATRRAPPAGRTVRAPAAAEAPAGRAALTSATRVLYPDAGVTKADVYGYYQEVAPLLVPVLTGRPIAVQQWPAGVDKPGFFRHQLAGYPAWLPTQRVEHETKTVEHVDVSSPDALLWLANQSALTLHMWASHAPTLDTPDWVVFDLDPGAGTFDDVIQSARLLRKLLEELGLQGFPKTSGKRGVHVLVPLAPGHTFAQADAFADGVMAALERGLPQLTTTQRSKAARGGKLYLDAGQNWRGKTLVAPYSLRATPGATYSAPLAWEEVNGRLDPARLTLRTLRRRLDKVGDLFAPVLRVRQKLPALR